ncbi:MAG: two component transcriptional regulator, winged helix family [Nitrospirae bacterium]|jgi:two-component system KDP operon response regulator KdpE|nr:two component transcriptional regulator, winged helix family [Nitrospirota bacterium]
MPQNKETILLIEDEPQMERFLRIVLQGQGYNFYEAQTGQEGLTQAATRSPDIILLDLGLPDIDGLEVTKRLREWSDIPIIVISAREQEQDKIKALDAGADDYLSKPFGAGELLARIRVAIRHKVMRQSTAGEPIFTIDNLRVDMLRRQVFLNEQEVHLTPIEYKLLTVLIQNAGKVVTHNQLLKEVWGPSYTKETQYLRVYMTQLRHKLESDPARPRFLINEPGIGYRLKIDLKE